MVGDFFQRCGAAQLLGQRPLGFFNFGELLKDVDGEPNGAAFFSAMARVTAWRIHQ